MTIADRVRAGYRPTLAEKLATCGSLEELSGMVVGLRERGHSFTQEEALAAQDCRARLLEAER